MASNNEVQDFYVNTLQGSPATILMEVLNADYTNIQQDELTSITYSIYEQNSGTYTATDEEVTVEDAIYDSYQTGQGWDGPSQGWNFKHSPLATYTPDAKRYRIIYTFTPEEGQPFKRGGYIECDKA